ncbi:hypothetical protein V6N11_049279 [Hibiscus sabdariffa]|uniref:Uncharacterized protein n=2 Tax=Hibiscus sabdariffa TaxID=183260 RepID=A0ABR2P078_9ROSI
MEGHTDTTELVTSIKMLPNHNASLKWFGDVYLDAQSKVFTQVACHSTSINNNEASNTTSEKSAHMLIHNA